jgi:hypothetical protein
MSLRRGRAAHSRALNNFAGDAEAISAALTMTGAV